MCTHTHTDRPPSKEKYRNVSRVDLWVEELRVMLIFFFTLTLLSRFSTMKINNSKIDFFHKEVDLSTYAGP